MPGNTVSRVPGHLSSGPLGGRSLCQCRIGRSRVKTVKRADGYTERKKIPVWTATSPTLFQRMLSRKEMRFTRLTSCENFIQYNTDAEKEQENFYGLSCGVSSFRHILLRKKMMQKTIRAASRMPAAIRE